VSRAVTGAHANDQENHEYSERDTAASGLPETRLLLFRWSTGLSRGSSPRHLFGRDGMTATQAEPGVIWEFCPQEGQSISSLLLLAALIVRDRYVKPPALLVVAISDRLQALSDGELRLFSTGAPPARSFVLYV